MAAVGCTKLAQALLALLHCDCVIASLRIAQLRRREHRKSKASMKFDVVAS